MKQFFRNVSALYSVNAVNGVLGIVFVPVAVHRLGAAGYGVFSMYAVLAGYIALVELGLGKNLVRLLGIEPSAAGQLRQLRLAWGLYLSASLFLLLLLPALWWGVPRWVFPVPPETRLMVQLVVLFSLLEYVAGTPVALMTNRCLAQEGFGRYSRFVLASGLVRYVLSFAAVFLIPRADVVVGVIAARRLVDIPLARLIMGGLPSGAWLPSIDLRAYRALVGHSAVLSLGQFLQVSVVSIGSVLVNATLGLQALGTYRAVFDLASKLWFFSGALGFVAFPTFVRMMSIPDQQARLGRVLPQALSTSWAFYAALGVAGAVAGPILLRVVQLGQVETVQLFVLVLAGVAFNAHMGMAYEVIQASGFYRRSVLLAGTSLAVMLGVYFIAARWQPLLAIGWAWLVSQSLVGMAADIAVVRQFGAPLLSPQDLAVRGILLLCVLAGALAVLGRASLWLLVPSLVVALAILGRALWRLPQLQAAARS